MNDPIASKTRLWAASALASGLGLFAAVGCESKAPTQVAPEPTQISLPAPASGRAPAAPVHRVEVDDAGFRPARVSLGATRTLVFRRTTDSTCATAVVFPALGIEKALLLNKDVAIELPATLKDEVTFQCGMGMFKGMVLAR
jgi:plastocyanin domain-containing protein